jgi:brassinosteroid-6-oxidase 2
MMMLTSYDYVFFFNCSWQEVGGDKLMKFPRVQAPNGLHMRFSSY